MKNFEWLGRDIIVGPFTTLCRSQADFEAALAHVKMTTYRHPWLEGSADATTHHFKTPKGAQCCVVTIRPDIPEPLVICGLLVHEAVHIFQILCDNIGERHPSEEFEAYSIQAIAQQLMQEYSRQTFGEQKGN